MGTKEKHILIHVLGELCDTCKPERDSQALKQGQLMGAEKSGKMVVDHVMDGGHGDKAGVKVGDVLRATTARTKVLPTLTCPSSHTLLPRAQCTAQLWRLNNF